MLNGNALRGMLPATWPTSRMRFDVEHNLEFAGKIAQELVLQCSRGFWQQVVPPTHTTMLIGSMRCAMDPLGVRFAVGKAFKSMV